MRLTTTNYYSKCNRPTFSELFEDFNTWYTAYQEYQEEVGSAAFDSILNEAFLKSVYYGLYERYAGSTILTTDNKRFTMRMFGIIRDFGPEYAKKLDIQKKLRNLTEEQIKLGSKAIYNNAQNPNSEPSTDSLEELPYINGQNTTSYKKSPIDAYSNLWMMLDSRLVTEFFDRFNPLFSKVLTHKPTLYYTEIQEEED